MCLMPFGGDSFLIPPTGAARQTADFLKVVLGLHFLLVICLFLSVRIIDAIVDMIGLGFGYWAISNSEGYSVQKILCYCIFCGMDFFWAVIRLIILFAHVDPSSEPSQDWSLYIFYGSTIAAPIIYFAATFFSRKLYYQLRDILNSSLSGAGGDMEGGFAPRAPATAPAAAAAAAPSSGARWSHPAAHPTGNYAPAAAPAAAPAPAAAASSGGGNFRAFAGPGRRLGD